MKPGDAQAQVQGKSENAAPFNKPRIGSDVWYFDETRAVSYSKMGSGPYTARVVWAELRGVTLFVMTPQGAFNVAEIQHKSELPEGAARKKWWEWPR